MDSTWYERILLLLNYVELVYIIVILQNTMQNIRAILYISY